MYMETCTHIVYLKYRNTRAANVHDESDKVQVSSNPPSEKTHGDIGKRYHRRIYVPTGSLSGSAPGSSAIGPGGR